MKTTTVIGLGLLAVAGFLGFRWYKKSQEETATPTGGETTGGETIGDETTPEAPVVPEVKKTYALVDIGILQLTPTEAKAKAEEILVGINANYQKSLTVTGKAAGGYGVARSKMIGNVTKLVGTAPVLVDGVYKLA